MKITDWKTLDVRETPHKVDVRLLYETDDAQVMHIQLKPGEELKPHFTPVDVFFFVLEGTPTILELVIPGLLLKAIRMRSRLAIPDYKPGSVLSASNETRRRTPP